MVFARSLESEPIVSAGGRCDSREAARLSVAYRTPGIPREQDDTRLLELTRVVSQVNEKAGGSACLEKLMLTDDYEGLRG